MTHTSILGSASRSAEALVERLCAATLPEGAAFVAVALPEALLADLAPDLDAWRGAAVTVWELPAQREHLFGFGKAIELRGASGDAIAAALPAARAALAQVAGADLPAALRPRLFGGARFDAADDERDAVWAPFGGWAFVLPRLLIAVDGGGGLSGSLTVPVEATKDPSSLAAMVEGDLRALGAAGAPRRAVAAGAHCASPEADAWRASVVQALREMREHRYEKVVLAQQIGCASGADFDPGAILGRLAHRYRECAVFKFAPAPEAAWIGASPELLVSFTGGVVRSSSLAGSRPRSDDPGEDAALGRELLADEKERREHELVVRATREAMTPLCTALTIPDEPRLMRVPNIQHLHTPVEGRAKPGTDVLDFLERMHPTPAVGGWPRDAAREAIGRIEHMDRGWYAGPIGWVDAAGDGAFAVALRSALVCGREARLFAGAGIVLGSDPDRELAEIELKLRPLLDALGGA